MRLSEIVKARPAGQPEAGLKLCEPYNDVTSLVQYGVEIVVGTKYVELI